MAATLSPPPTTERSAAVHRSAPAAVVPARAFRFESLVLSERRSLASGRSTTLAVSLVLHAVLITAVIIVPVVFDEFLPAANEASRAIFVMPPVAAPPPPPPPPPAPGVRAVTRTPVAPQPETEPKFVAPIETPAEIKPEQGLDLGVEGGVPGGVEGGVPGGVVGGIVGGLPEKEAPPVQAVRVGGAIKAPKILKRVEPVYPPLAVQARISALIILEATVDGTGHVVKLTVLRGQPLFDDAAVEAVKQWVYKPLLLNGVPTPFVLSVTVNFHLGHTTAEEPAS
jgi:periplasmic protein TonB